MFAYLMINWRKDPAKKRKLQGLVRAAAYLTVVGAGASFLSIRAARADVAEKGLSIGRQLDDKLRNVIGATQHETTHLVMNGEHVYVSSSVAKGAPYAAVLERFASMCESEAAQAPEEWSALSKSPVSVGQRHSHGGVIRTDSGQDGVVICFVKSKSAKPTLKDALGAFVETGNLSAIGDLRYAYVKGAEDGSALVLTAWTHERFDFRAFGAEEGKDAVGSDFPDVPRPSGSWRMLSATADGAGYAVNVYRTAEAPEKVAALYDAEMTKLGYLGGDVPLHAEAGSAGNKLGRSYAKGAAMLTVGMHVEGGHTFVAVGLSGNPASTRAGRE